MTAKHYVKLFGQWGAHNVPDRIIQRAACLLVSDNKESAEYSDFLDNGVTLWKTETGIIAIYRGGEHAATTTI